GVLRLRLPVLLLGAVVLGQRGLHVCSALRRDLAEVLLLEVVLQRFRPGGTARAAAGRGHCRGHRDPGASTHHQVLPLIRSPVTRAARPVCGVSKDTALSSPLTSRNQVKNRRSISLRCGDMYSKLPPRSEISQKSLDWTASSSSRIERRRSAVSSRMSSHTLRAMSSAFTAR